MKEGGGDLDQFTAVKGDINCTIEIASKGNVLHSNKFLDVFHRLNEAFDEVVRAESRTKETNAKDTARTGDPDDVTILEIALVVADAADSRVRRDDGAFGEANDVIDDGLGGVGNVDKDALFLKLSDDILTKGRQTSLLHSMRTSSQFCVEKVCGGHHADAFVVKGVDSLKTTFKRVETFDSKESCRNVVCLSIADVLLEICFVFDESQTASGVLGGVLELRRLEKDSIPQTLHGVQSPSLNETLVGDRVGEKVGSWIGLKVEEHWGRSDNREALKRDVSFEESFDIDVAESLALVDVTACGPKERVGVEIREPEPLVESSGLVVDVVKVGPLVGEHAVERRVEVGGQTGAEDDANGRDEHGEKEDAKAAEGSLFAAQSKLCEHDCEHKDAPSGQSDLEPQARHVLDDL